MVSTLKIALVPGGSRGLGLLVSRELLDRGYAVAIAARDHDELTRAKERLSPHGTVEDYVCDVRDADAVKRLVREVEQDMGPVEVLVTVAGIIQAGPLEAVTVEHFKDAIDTMTYGPIYCALEVLPGMRQRRSGRIGTVTSVGGLVSPPHLLPYATAKFGAVGFSEGLAVALAGSGVTATTIAPGLMRTGSHERAFFTDQSAKEYAWFAPAASLPVLSMNADRAARIIVDGVLAGKPTVLVGWLPKVAQRVHGLAPGLTTRAMGLANRLLPGARPEQSGLREGRDVASALNSKVVKVLTTLGSKAARKNNERG